MGRRGFRGLGSRGPSRGLLQSWAPSTANTGLKTGKKDRVHLASSSPHFLRSLQSSSGGLEFSPRPGGDLPGSCSPVGTLTLFRPSWAPRCLSLWSSDGPGPPPTQASQVPPPTLASVHTPRPLGLSKAPPSGLGLTTPGLREHQPESHLLASGQTACSPTKLLC